MATRTDLLVVGAGPYAYSVAAFARDRGIDTRVVGRPMAFWREQMPADMYPAVGDRLAPRRQRRAHVRGVLRGSGSAARGLRPDPAAVFLDYTDWFGRCKGLEVDERLVAGLTSRGDGFVATLDDGTAITAEKVLAAPGVRYFVNLPAWYAEVPAQRRGHTSDIVSFDDLVGARVAIIGGRQSAYEWAALLCDHGAEHVDVVHRHATPEFAKVSWAFVDAYVEQTLAQRGWWRHLSDIQQREITRNFWRVGRLTLEPWLVPRIAPEVVTSHPGTEVTRVAVGDEDVTLTLSNGAAVGADKVVFASGYRADLARVPYLAGVLDQVSVTEGYPDLSEGFETSLPGLYLTGFAATRDFGPFYGFTKGCPSAARIAVSEMTR